jgi:hypothetical protein
MFIPPASYESRDTKGVRILAGLTFLCVGLQAQIVFTHASVFDGTLVFRNQTVTVDDGKIVALGRRVADPAVYGVIDASGKTLMARPIKCIRVTLSKPADARARRSAALASLARGALRMSTRFR